MLYAIVGGACRLETVNSCMQTFTEYLCTEAVVPFGRQWAPSDMVLKRVWQIVQALIKKGLGDELNSLYDNFLFAVEQYNEMAPNSELEELSDRHLHQIYEYGKSINWAPLSRAGFKARQRGIAQSWGKEVTS